MRWRGLAPAAAGSEAAKLTLVGDEAIPDAWRFCEIGAWRIYCIDRTK